MDLSKKQTVYQSLFQAKCTQFLQQFKLLNLPLANTFTVKQFPSPPINYRARIEFTLHRIEQKSGQQQWRYVMFDENKTPIRFTNSDIPLTSISKRMPHLLEFLAQHPSFAHKLFQCNWRAQHPQNSSEPKVLLSLIYHRPLALETEETSELTAKHWLKDAHKLAQTLDLTVIGRSRSQVLTAGGTPYLDSILPFDTEEGLNNLTYYIRQDDTCFSQPNSYTNVAMLSWARQHFASSPENPKDLLELYCGIGNFSCALAQNFRQILATEVVRKSIQLCQHNIQANSLLNVKVIRLSAAETIEALEGQRSFNRVHEAGLNLNDYSFSHLLLDPPRSGLDAQCRDFAMNFKHILYISCNPTKLLEDLNYWQTKNTTYQMQAMAIFDQFPYTQHLEVAVILSQV